MFFAISMVILFNLAAQLSYGKIHNNYKQFIHSVHKEESFFQRFLEQFKEQPFDGSYAIVISVSKYDHLAPLRSAKKDAQKMKDFLLNNGYYDEVIVLEDSDASRDNIGYFMETYFPKKMKQEGRYRFLFYFTGHGKDFRGNRGNMGYLLLKGASGEIESHDMIDMARVESWSNKLLYVKHGLFLLDCCFSGLAGVETKSYDTRVNPLDMAKQNGMYMITAGTAKQKSIGDSNRWKGSLFTDVAVNGMKQHADRNDDGVVTTYELFSYIQGAVAIEAKKVRHEQTPQLSNMGRSNDTGQFFFVYRDLGKREDKQPLCTTTTATCIYVCDFNWTVMYSAICKLYI